MARVDALSWLHLGRWKARRRRHGGGAGGRQRLPEIAESDLHRRALGEARELIAVNAVRGASPVVELDGRPVGDGRPGPAALRLREILDSAR